MNNARNTASRHDTTQAWSPSLLPKPMMNQPVWALPSKRSWLFAMCSYGQPLSPNLSDFESNLNHEREHSLVIKHMNSRARLPRFKPSYFTSLFLSLLIYKMGMSYSIWFLGLSWRLIWWTRGKCLDQGLGFLLSSVQLLSRVWLFATPWTAAHQASLSISNSCSLLKLMELVMPSNHLILCHPLLLLPSIFPSIRVFSNEKVGVPTKLHLKIFIKHLSNQWFLCSPSVTSYPEMIK